MQPLKTNALPVAQVAPNATGAPVRDTQYWMENGSTFNSAWNMADAASSNSEGGSAGSKGNIFNTNTGKYPVNAMPPPASPTNRDYYTAHLEPHTIKHLGTVDQGVSADSTRVTRGPVNHQSQAPVQPKRRSIGWVKQK